MFKATHHRAWDAFVMKNVEIFSERLGGMPPRKDAWQRLHKGARAGFAGEASPIFDQ